LTYAWGQIIITNCTRYMYNAEAYIRTETKSEVQKENREVRRCAA
jgi:hypothetical protein